MSNGNYKFYMQECTSYGSPLGAEKDLEADFEGLRYAKCEGLDTYGKPRVYTETYADSDTLRAYVPSELTRDATKVTFTFYFKGENRRATYFDFLDYVSNGYHIYRDTARGRKFVFIVTEEIKPASEKWYGNEPYLELKLTVQNLNGKTEKV